MKKLSFLFVVVMLLSFTSRAATFYRELYTFNGNPLPGFSGRSTVAMSTGFIFSPPVELEQGEGFSNSWTSVTRLVITFEPEASSGTTSWNLYTNMISTSSYSEFTIGSNHLYIKKTGSDSYTYYCVYIP